MNKGISSLCVDFAATRRLLEVIGGERKPTDTIAVWLYRIADKTGLEYRVVRAVWNRERLSPETARKLKLAAKNNENLNAKIAERLEWSAAVLNEQDAEMFGDEIEARRQLALRIRNLNRGKD